MDAPSGTSGSSLNLRVSLSHLLSFSGGALTALASVQVCGSATGSGVYWRGIVGVSQLLQRLSGCGGTESEAVLKEERTSTCSPPP